MMCLCLICVGAGSGSDDEGFNNDKSIPSYPYHCTFGNSIDVSDWCNIVQDNTDHQDWKPWKGLSPTPNTGPLEEALTGHGIAVLL